MQFLKWAFLQNVWLWFHIFAAGLAAKVLVQFIPARGVLTIVLVAAVLWELGELLYHAVTEMNPYISFEQFLSDAFGDVMGAFLMALIVVI